MRSENARNSVLIRILMPALVLVIALATAGTAYAVSSYRTAFRAAYPAAVGTRIDSCVLCHPSGTGPRNSFGSDFASSSIGNRTFNAALANRDSDGDGSTNLAEINALTFPGDAADKPAAADTTPPTVSSTSPANNATGVAVGAAITATFSEAVAPASVNASSFTVGGVTGTISVNGATVTFTPSAPLATNTSYTATLTTAVTDVAGNHLAASRTWTFATTAAADSTVPRVSSVNPSDTQPGVPVNVDLTVTFSEAVIMPAGSFTLSDAAGSVPGTVSVAGATATFIPSVILSDDTTYTVRVTNEVTDLTGNHLADDYSWTFTTSAPSVGATPSVESESAGGGCAMAGTRGDIKDLAGTYGFLMLTALGIAVRGRMQRREK
jgi:hypothetical protein